MDTFQLIRQFFTRMTCRFCSTGFMPEDVHLIGRGSNYFVVAIHCHQCGKHNGDAAVGVEQMTEQQAAMAAAEPMEISLEELLEAFGRRFAPPEDPELTEADIRRLEDLPPISDDDVLEAHEFINNLDGNWMNHIPKALKRKRLDKDA